ncbi:MAG: methyltransferase [Pseudomonadota bacterium]
MAAPESDIDVDALEALYARALEAEKADAHAEAASLYRQMLEIDPDDCAGAGVRLAAIGQGETPDRASPAYVMTLFDQQAEAFDHILVDQLDYHIPEEMAAVIDQHAPGPYARALDLGCGTGLIGVHLGDRAGHLTGIDLSENMVELAAARGVYDDLYVGDVLGFLEEIDEPPWDLILAADVLPYLGDVDGLFRGAAPCLTPAGALIFSTELLEGEGSYRVCESHRFQHRSDYLSRELANAGFTVTRAEPATIRQEMGVPVAGQIILAQRG